MNQLQLFNYENRQLRVVEKDGQHLIVAQDLSDMLGYGQTTKALQILEEDEKLRCQIGTSGQNRDMWCVTESGMWCLIIKSSKPEAKKIRKWVTSEVLPSIRKTGGYELPKATHEAPTVWCFKQDYEELMSSIMEVSDTGQRKRVWETMRKYIDRMHITF